MIDPRSLVQQEATLLYSVLFFQYLCTALNAYRKLLTGSPKRKGCGTFESRA